MRAARHSAARLLPALLVALLGVTTLPGCDDATGPAARFTEGEVEFYLDVALGNEFAAGDLFVRKWTQDLAVAVEGSPTSADLEELDRVLSEIDELYASADVRRAPDRASANVVVFFVPRSRFDEILPDVRPGNDGFFSVAWNDRGEIREAVVLIDSGNELGQVLRDHLVREELTQVLGLVDDSDRYLGSVFNQIVLLPSTEYLPVDSTLVRIHGLAEIEPGMREADVRAALRGR